MTTNFVLAKNEKIGQKILSAIQTRKRKKKTKQMKALIYFEIIDWHHWHLFAFCHTLYKYQNTYKEYVLKRNTLVISIPAAAEYL